MAALLEQWLDAIEQYYGTYNMYSTQWAQYFFTIPTITFILTVITICTPALVALFLYELEEAHLRASQPASCRKLGLNTESNLQNEFDTKFSEGQPPNSKEASPAAWRVKSIWIYPVKSCRGVELEEGTVIATGMEYDRQFSFAQLKDGPAATAHGPGKEGRTQKWEFITQRQYRLLATVKTEMWVPDKSVERYTHHAEEVESGGVVVLSFPYQEPGWRGILAKLRAALRGTVPEKRFRVPFDPSPAQIEKAGYTFEQMTIWKDTASALNLSVEVPPEVSTYLGMTNRLGLFRVDNSRLREVHRNAPRKEELGYQPVTGFQDAYPLHLLNLSSVHALSALISSSPSPQSQSTIPPPLPLSATRFRANIILTGPPAFAEDTFRLIHIGSTALAVCCRTARCKMPNVHPITGERHASEPDRTLRRERAVDRGAGKGVGCLGVQMVAMVDGRGLVRVGDGVVVEEWGESEYIPQ